LPYYYSLAFRASFHAEPVFPSLEYYYPEDDKAKNRGEMKMIGPFLLGSSAAKQGQKIASTYLPEGTWFDLRSGKNLASKGQWVKQDLYINKLFTLPLYAKQGALIPSTENKGNSLKVFGFGSQEFDWYDDDGSSSAYLQGDYQQIHLQSKHKELLFSRSKGDKLAINAVQWRLPANNKVKAVTSSLGSLKFIQQGTLVSITLPEFDQELTVELKI